MVMSIPTLTSASTLMEKAILIDSVNLYDVGATTTVGYEVTRTLTLVQPDMPALVQTTVLANAVESQVINTYSVKLKRGSSVVAGQAVKVIKCVQEPSLVGKVLLLDKVSQNGLSLIRKCVATDFHTVDQQGKGDL